MAPLQQVFGILIPHIKPVLSMSKGISDPLLLTGAGELPGWPLELAIYEVMISIMLLREISE